MLGTKYSLTLHPDDPNGGGNHRKSLVRNLEESLRRLRTDYIDVYWLHAWDFLTRPVSSVISGPASGQHVSGHGGALPFPRPRVPSDAAITSSPHRMAIPPPVPPHCVTARQPGWHLTSAARPRTMLATIIRS